MKKLSIVIPIYNGEKYVDHIIKNVLSQKYQNFELILVDDASSDNSVSICEKWAINDSRIKTIILKTNGGCPEHEILVLLQLLEIMCR